MNLTDAVIDSFSATPTSSASETAPLGDELSDKEAQVCQRCEVPDSKQLPNGTCDVCGAAWADEDEDDFNVALELLISCDVCFADILSNQKVMKKMGFHDETDLRNLALAVSDFIETYSFD